MILKQYYLGCLAHASYLVGDEQSGKAAIIDPQRDVDQYFADAEALGLHIEYVFLTHFHADFIAGHVELRNRTVRGFISARSASRVRVRSGAGWRRRPVRPNGLESAGNARPHARRHLAAGL